MVGIKTLPDDQFYPWDIIDTSKLEPDEITLVQFSRQERGIPIAIDKIVKSYGIPIGDKALREWNRFRKKNG